MPWLYEVVAGHITVEGILVVHSVQRDVIGNDGRPGIRITLQPHSILGAVS